MIGFCNDRESAEQFTDRARSLMREALQLSDKISTDNAAFNRCMATAKRNDFTYVDGLRYTVETLRGEHH